MWGRRTNVWTHHIDDLVQLAVIKDSDCNLAWRFTEAKLLECIRAAGSVPGVVRLLHHEDVMYKSFERRPRKIETVGHFTPGRSQKVKSRLVLSSFGTPLCEAKSVKDILMAIYDLLEGWSLICVQFSCVDISCSTPHSRDETSRFAS